MEEAEKDIDRKMSLKAVRAEVEHLLADPNLGDSDLRDALSRLSRAWAFPSLTWLWGPTLYRRNRILFRPFIIRYFGSWQYPGFRPIPWKGETGRNLETWFGEVDQADDITLFQRLYEWKHSRRWNDQEIRARLIELYRNAESPATRQVVLDKFQIWFTMDEPTACALYELEPKLAKEYLQRRIPTGGWLEAKRKTWQTLYDLAERQGDEKFRDLVYRNRIPIKDWENDLAAACDRITNHGELVTWMKDHHPAGWGLKLGGGFLKAVEKRGRDVFPYFYEHIHSVGRGLVFDGHFKKLKKIAEQNQWWDFWTALIRQAGTAKEYNEAVAEQVKSSAKNEAINRLGMLSGISREFNFGGFGMAGIHTLNDQVALDLYRNYPDLLTGAFKANIQATSWIRYPRLTDAFIEAEDESMIDFMAGRVLTFLNYHYGSKKTEAEIERLATYYENLKSNPEIFADRAASALARVPAFTIYSYRNLIKGNRLARLLFELSPKEFLASKSALGEMVEAQEIHVMALAYRVLGLDDPRAREAAAENIDILLGIPLRPLQRKTRLPAFKALLNAATTEENATRILIKAREAIDLPDKKYPKEQLIGLIGQLLHRWPALRDPAEQPVIYRAA